MALKRIYTFDEELGFGLNRVVASLAGPQDRILQPLNISNWQLGLLYVVGLQGNATSSEIGYALVMDRSTVTQNMRSLDDVGALNCLSPSGGRKGAVELTDKGRELLSRGLRLWREANAPISRDGASAVPVTSGFSCVSRTKNKKSNK